MTGADRRAIGNARDLSDELVGNRNARGTEPEVDVDSPTGDRGIAHVPGVPTDSPAGLARGTEATRTAILLQMQQTHGNGAVQLFVQRATRAGSAVDTDEDLATRLQAATDRGGTPLEADVQRRLEHGLGSDLSGVRVHTDHEADSMARSINAVAFTTGPDIFFRSGAYDIQSTKGLGLLAHEAVHTLQQSTGPVAGNLTESGVAISDPHDLHEQAAEREATRALNRLDQSQLPQSNAEHRGRHVAPAMDRTLAVQRKMSSDLDDMAEAGGANALAAEQREHELNKEPPIQRVSNISDARSALVMAQRIESWRGQMQEGAAAGGAFTVSPNRVTPDKMAANETAVQRLDDYLVTAGEQSRTLGSFQDALQKARVDYERLNAQVTHLTVTNAIAGGSAGQIGQQVVQAAGFSDPDSARKRMQQIDQDPAMLAVHDSVQKAHDEMLALSQDVGGKQSAVSTAAYTYEAALNEFKTGIPTVNTNPDQAKELNELKEKIETVKQAVGKGLEWAAKGAEAAGVKGADKAVEPAKKVADFLTDQYFDSQLNEINTKISQYNTAHAEHAISANLDKLRAASRTFTQSLRDFDDTCEKFARKQETFRELLRGYGRSADRGQGDKFAQIASVLAEVDTYEMQLDEALRLGYQEQTAAKEAASSRQTLEGQPGQGGATEGATPYYEPYKWFHNNGGWSYECQRHELNLHRVLTNQYGKGSAGGPAGTGVNATVDDAIAKLQEYRKEIDPMRRALATAMNLNMDSSMPVTAGGPAPTQRSANQGL